MHAYMTRTLVASIVSGCDELCGCLIHNASDESSCYFCCIAMPIGNEDKVFDHHKSVSPECTAEKNSSPRWDTSESRRDANNASTMPSMAGSDPPGEDEAPPMAAVYYRGMLGIAWYTVHDAQARAFVLSCCNIRVPPSQLHVMQAADDANSSLPTLCQAVLEVQPSVVYVPSTASPSLLAALTTDDLPGCTVQKERAGTFTPERALSMLHNARIRGLTDDVALPARERLLRISACINLASTAQVCAAGALLSILQRSGHGDLCGLREARLQGHLQVDVATLHGLQVCRDCKIDTRTSTADLCHRDPSERHGHRLCQGGLERVWPAQHMRDDHGAPPLAHLVYAHPHRPAGVPCCVQATCT